LKVRMPSQTACHLPIVVVQFPQVSSSLRTCGLYDMNLNINGFLNVFRCLVSPSLCLPHATVSTFNELPIPLDKAFEARKGKAAIKAVVLDKDDCFAYPDSNVVFESNKVGHRGITFSATASPVLIRNRNDSRHYELHTRGESYS